MKPKKAEFQQHLATTTLGERGQVVIPKDLRDAIGLKAGDGVVFMHHGHGPIVMFPLEHMKTYMGEMMSRISALQTNKNNL